MLAVQLYAGVTCHGMSGTVVSVHCTYTMFTMQSLVDTRGTILKTRSGSDACRLLSSFLYGSRRDGTQARRGGGRLHARCPARCKAYGTRLYSRTVYRTGSRLLDNRAVRSNWSSLRYGAQSLLTVTVSLLFGLCDTTLSTLHPPCQGQGSSSSGSESVTDSVSVIICGINILNLRLLDASPPRFARTRTGFRGLDRAPELCRHENLTTSRIELAG